MIHPSLRLQARSGFTLVEMLVAIGIILALATLTVMVVPSVNTQRGLDQGAEDVQGVFLIAKQRAFRDTKIFAALSGNNEDRGIALVGESAPGSMKYTQLQLIASLPNYTPQTAILTVNPGPPDPTTVVIQTPVNFLNVGPNATGEVRIPTDPLMDPNRDFLELNTSVITPPRSFRIEAGSYTPPPTMGAPGTVTLTVFPPITVVPPTGLFLQAPAGFRFHRPRVEPVLGEDPIDLPQGVTVRNRDEPTQTQIMFSGNGSAYYPPIRSKDGKIFLVIEHAELPGEEEIIAITARTGAIELVP